MLLNLLYLSLVCTYADGNRILLIPFDNLAHERFYAVAGDALNRDGHEVYMIVMRPTDFLQKDFSGIKTLVPSLSTPSLIDTQEEYVDISFKHGDNIAKIFPLMCNNSVKRCEEVLTDASLMQQIENMQFDLVIIDGSDFARCLYIIPYKFGIPYITLGVRVDPWNAGLPVLPALEPTWGSFFDPKTSSMSEKIHIFVQYIKLYLFMPQSSVYTDSLIRKYAPNRDQTTFSQLFKDSEMWLMHYSPICHDWHRISAPHYQFIGGLGVTDPKPLPDNIRSILESTNNGVILVTFGSALTHLPTNVFQTLLSAFKELKYEVIMQQNHPERHSVPGNVHLYSWLPQNDILGHPNTKLFFTHGGNNAQLEAIYHAVPMVALPVYGDQKYNAHRAQVRGYGVTLPDHKSVTPEDIINAVDHVLSTPSFRQAIKNCSDITRAMPRARDQLTFWVNHVLRFGGKHLKPSYMDYPLYKLFMLDVLGVILLLLLACLCVLCVVVYIACKMCKVNRVKSKTA